MATCPFSPAEVAAVVVGTVAAGEGMPVAVVDMLGVAVGIAAAEAVGIAAAR